MRDVWGILGLNLQSPHPQPGSRKETKLKMRYPIDPKSLNPQAETLKLAPCSSGRAAGALVRERDFTIDPSVTTGFRVLDECAQLCCTWVSVFSVVPERDTRKTPRAAMNPSRILHTQQDYLLPSRTTYTLLSMLVQGMLELG